MNTKTKMHNLLSTFLSARLGSIVSVLAALAAANSSIPWHSQLQAQGLVTTPSVLMYDRLFAPHPRLSSVNVRGGVVIQSERTTQGVTETFYIKSTSKPELQFEKGMIRTFKLPLKSSPTNEITFRVTLANNITLIPKLSTEDSSALGNSFSEVGPESKWTPPNSAEVTSTLLPSDSQMASQPLKFERVVNDERGLLFQFTAIGKADQILEVIFADWLAFADPIRKSNRISCDFVKVGQGISK